VLSAPGRFEIADVPIPDVAPDEVLLRVAACGVCTSELAAFAGTEPTDYPRHLGHEVSGTVVAAGPDAPAPVVGTPVGAWVTSHGFAEYVTAKAAHCRPAGEVPLEQALTEPLACAVNAVEEADVRLGDDVVLIGAGFMGNLVQALVGLRGVRRPTPARTRWNAPGPWAPPTSSTCAPRRCPRSSAPTARTSRSSAPAARPRWTSSAR
jgi:threonine dehydrogenase-like Zn-dependent dehydrogenase